MTWYTSGNHKVPDYEKDEPEARCPHCGSKDIEDTVVCTCGDEIDECATTKCDLDDDKAKKEICTDRKPGLKCEHCDHVWRE